MEDPRGKTSRRRRFAAAPSLEALEGRRLLAARGATIAIQEGSSNGVAELIVNGTNRADVIHIADNGTGNPGNVTVTLGDGTKYTSHAAVEVVAVSGKGGDDQVSYDLTGPLVASRSVLVNLGAGNDQFTGNIAGDIDNTDGLNLQVVGGAGNDNLSINQTGKTVEGTFIPYLEGDAGNDTLSFKSTGDIAPNAAVVPGLTGGAGNDTITSDYTGLIRGNYIYNLTEDGGAGNDVMTDDIHVLSGSSGTVGTDAQTPAIVRGGAGRDQIHFAIHVDPTARATQVAAVVSGGAGKDAIQRTSNVTGDPTNESDTIIS